MNLRFLKTVLIGCVVGLFYKAGIAQQQPNILFIHIDDLGFHDLSVHGSKIYQTPNIDKLADASVSFTQAYANYPRCVPSRFAMMTGDYPISKGGVPEGGFDMKSIPEKNNFVKQLNKSGYQTAYFGKWHLSKGDETPKDFGYTISVAAGAPGSPISYLYPFNEKKGKGGKPKKIVPDVDAVSKEGDYLTDIMTDEVIKYIENVDKSKPFMAVLAYYAVHQPLEAKEKDTDRNKKEINSFNYGDQPAYVDEGHGRTKMRQDNAIYAGMVENLDLQIGKLLKKLKDLNLDDNTMVIFSSDHGGLSNTGSNNRGLATSNYPLRAGKGWIYEGGIKVPLFIKWKGFTPRKDNNSIITLMDVFPTLLDFTSDKQVKGIAGKSFMPVLNKKEKWNDRTIFWHATKNRPESTGEYKYSAVRDGDYKLIHFYETDVVELYNIKKDPSEKNNLAITHASKTNSLMSKLTDWKKTF